MSRFGWAYVNSLVTGAVANGPTNSVQFNSGSQVLSGSSNFTFDPATNTLIVTGTISASVYQGISTSATAAGSDKQIQFNSGSTFSGSTNLTFDYTTNTLYLTGTLRADTLIVSSSQILKSGSTIFGDDTADTHQFTGSVYNTTLVSGTTARFTTISGSELNVSGVSTLDGQVRAFGGIQARNSNISVTNLAGTTTLATMTTAGLVSGSTAQFTTITGSTITGSTGLLTTLSASYISSSQIANVDFIDFNTGSTAPTYRQGRLYYDSDTFDLAYYLPITNEKLEIGQQTIVRVKNSTGSPIAKGKLVHIIGGVGNNPLIGTASWENDANSANTLGMLMSTIAHNDFGYVLLNGVITDVNTDPATFTAGQVIYLSSSGDYTATPPVAPKHTVRLGEVVRAHATVGSIYIKVDNGYEIEELHNVLITSASAGDLLVYNSSSALWENKKSLTGSYVITGSLTATSNISGATGQFTSLTASSISANSVPAFGPTQAIQFNNAGTLNGSANLTFDGTQVRLTGSMQVVSSSTAVVELVSTGVRTTGKPIQVRNVSTAIVAVMDENGIVSGSTGRFGNITGSVITSSNEILVANNVTIGGNILGSGAFKSGYLTYTGSFTIPSNSYFVGISTTGSIVTASLNSATSYPAGQTMHFKDIGGNAGTNNIRIQPSGSQTIDGATSLIISNTSGSATLVSNGVDGFYIVGLT